MKELRIEHKKNEHLIFGKTNPIRADEGASRPLHLGAPGADGLSKVFLNTNLNGQATCGGTIAPATGSGINGSAKPGQAQGQHQQ